jgi:capsular polysaccharide biosynthesis protein
MALHSKRIPGRPGLRAFRRRWWLIPLAVIAVAAAGYGAASLQKRLYTAESLIVVSSRATESDLGRRYDYNPGQASDAARLALTYASALPEDDRLLRRIATAVGRPLDEVDGRFSVTNDTDTATLHFRYRDEDPDRAAIGSRTAADGVTSSPPATEAVRAGTLDLVHSAERPEDRSDALVLATVLGAVLGLGLGAILIVAWDRADPRLDSPDDIQDLTSAPVTVLDTLSPLAVLALLERWYALSPARVIRAAILPAEPGVAPLAQDVARWLSDVCDDALERVRDDGDGSMRAVKEPSTQQLVPVRSLFRRRRQPRTTVTVNSRPDRATTAPPERITLVAGNVPGSPSAGEAEALRSDLVVLLIPRGHRSRQLAATATLLEEYGHGPDWVLFVQSPRAARRRIAEKSPASVEPSREAEEEARTAS